MEDEMLIKAANAASAEAKEIQEEIARRLLQRYNANADMLRQDFIDELSNLADAADHYKRLESLIRPKVKRNAKEPAKIAGTNISTPTF